MQLMLDFFNNGLFTLLYALIDFELRTLWRTLTWWKLLRPLTKYYGPVFILK